MQQQPQPIENRMVEMTIEEDGAKKRPSCCNTRRLAAHLPHLIGLTCIKIAWLLTEMDLVRGNRKLFLYSCIVCIAFGVLEGLLHFISCCLTRRKVKKNPFELFRVKVIVKFVFLVGFILGFGMLSASLLSSTHIEEHEKYGCKGYGCSNIMAIVGAIYTGLQAIATSIAIVILLCGEKFHLAPFWIEYANFT